MNDRQNHELTELTVGIENKGQTTINHEDGHKTLVAPSSLPTTMKAAGSSSRNINSVTAGVITSGSGATTNINNPQFMTVPLQAEAITKVASLTSSDLASQNTMPREIQMITGRSVVADHGGVVNIHNHAPPLRQSSTEANKEDRIKTILQTIHENTWRKTQVNVGETFRRDKFPEPYFEVHPQMAESPNFYKGGHKVVDSDDNQHIGYHEMEKRTRKPEMVKKAEYKKDVKFTFSDDDDDDQHSHSLSAESLIKKIHEKKEKLGVLGIVAQAGAGKTTCMRRWARHTMAMSGITEKNRYTASKNSRFELVHFIDLKSVENSDSTSLQEFLFNDCDAEANEAAYNWILKNQDKAVIFLDGLDQTQSIRESDERSVNHPSSASSRTLLFNLLSRNHLPGVRLVVSSREHSATSLPDEAKFDEVITLTGFTKEDAKKLFNVITAEDDKDDLSCESQTANVEISDHSFEWNMTNWDKLNKTSSELIPFISIPVFLIFTAIVFKDHGSVPSTLTDLMVKVIQALKYSTTHSTLNQEHEKVRTIIDKLKKLSHKGMDKGLVMFSKDDIKKCELKTEDIRDLLLKIIKSRSLYVLEGDNVFFFCHQIIEEFLSACYIVEMSLEDFKEFVKTKLNQDHWSVVRRFVCGLIFTKSRNEELLDICNKIEKQQFLRQNLTNLLKERTDVGPLELYAAIYESNDDQVIRSITDIKIYRRPLSSDGAHLIGSLMAKCKKLNLFEMVECNLNSRSLHNMAKSIGCSKIKVEKTVLKERHCSFNFDDLNNFLEHIDSDEVKICTQGIPRYEKEDGQMCEFDWRNIRQLRIEVPAAHGGFSICFRDSRDSTLLYVSIPEKTSGSYLGSYSKKNKTLTLEPEKDFYYAIHYIAIAVSWLNRCLVSLDTKHKLYVQYLHHKKSDLVADQDITRNGKIVPISDILLYFMNSEESQNIGSFMRFGREINPSFSMLTEKYEDAVIPSRLIEGTMGKIAPVLHLRDFEKKVHSLQEFIGTKDAQTHVAISKNTKVESCQLVFCCEEYSFNNLTSSFRNLPKQSVIVFVALRSWPYGLNSAELEKLEAEAHSNGIELTFLCYQELTDPWNVINKRIENPYNQPCILK